MNQLVYFEAFLTLATQQLDTLIKFYTGLLGEAPKAYMSNSYAEFQLSGLKLGIFKPQAANFPEFAAPSSGAMSLCLEVQDLEAAIAHLTHLGYPPPGTPTTASHGREIYAYDPDGNRLILHQGNLNL
ncbi:MAG: VOC family protein [Cyanobacteria bacterium P01_H01_bin.58]